MSRRPIRYIAERTPPDPTELGPVRLYAEYEDEARVEVRQVVYHSPTGLEWGYGGSGPADMALTILSHFFGIEPEGFSRKIKRARVLTDEYTDSERWVLQCHHSFVFEHVATAGQAAPLIVYTGDIERFKHDRDNAVNLR